MSDSNYKLRKRVKELEIENGKLKSDKYELKGVLIDIFDKMSSVGEDKYYTPKIVLSWFRPFLIKM